uniref:Synembryn-A n=1 Tax=Heterorhabditis bacteriophora TaxID=37862 RepID=A0A1I7XCI4_HETBA
MVEVLNIERLKSIMSTNDEEVLLLLKSINSKLADQNHFSDIDYFTRQEIVKLVEMQRKSPVLVAPLLELLRILARDKNQLEVILTESIEEFIIYSSALIENPGKIVVKDIMEAEKCLVNTLFNSAKMREIFEAKSVGVLLERIHRFIINDYSGNFEWINEMTEDMRSSLWYFDLRLAFLISAHSVKVQRTWGSDSLSFGTWVQIVKQYLEAAKQRDAGELPSDMEKRTERAIEACKILFNITFRRAEDIKSPFLTDITILVSSILKSKVHVSSMEQHAVNLMATLKLDYSILCPKMKSFDRCTEHFDLYDMSFAQALMDAMERKLDTNDKSDAELLSTYLGSALKLCTANKEARRYCRMKSYNLLRNCFLQILPPLKDTDVCRRPDEGNSLRNKIVRVMMSPAFSKDLAAEFLFVLCKRSVNRLIKYTGLGHAAGLLANSGLLGQINAPKNDSDSEDSETEEYKAIQDRVNPVTGCLRPPSCTSPFDGMSEEQKEYEAMRLVDAMHKLMNTGVIQPGTVGDDGRPRAVEHVLELAKNIPDVESDTDTE